MTIHKLATSGLFCFLLGVARGSVTLPIFDSKWLYLGVLSLPLIYYAFKQTQLSLTLFTLCLIAAYIIGYTYTITWRQYNFHKPEYDKKQTYQATVTDPPDIRADKILLSITLNTGPPTRVLAFMPRYPVYKYGDQLEITGSIIAPDSYDDFNYPLYLERYHLYGLILRPEKIRLINHNQANQLLAWLYQIRDHTDATILRILPEPEGSFLTGILLGSKRSIPTAVQEDLRATGTSHIIAISGANITITLSLLLALLPIYDKRKQFMATVVIAVFITLLTGACASVVRGAAIAILNSYLRLRSRRPWPTPLILFSMTLIILNNPLLLMADPGFQLSFAAFAGLAYLSQPVKNYMRQYAFFRKLPDAVSAAFTETTAATLGTIPISLLIFKQISLLGLIVNPLVLWLLPATTALGLLMACFYWLSGLVAIVKLPLWLLLHAALYIIGHFADLGLGVIKHSLTWNWVVAFYLILALLIYKPKPRHATLQIA